MSNDGYVVSSGCAAARCFGVRRHDFLYNKSCREDGRRDAPTHCYSVVPDGSAVLSTA